MRRSSGQSSDTSAAPTDHSPPIPTRQEPKDGQGPNSRGKCREEREERKGENTEHHGTHAAETIRDRSPNHRRSPAHHKKCEKQAAVETNVCGGVADSGFRQQVPQRGHQDQRVNKRIHAVHSPAAPGSPEAADLVRIKAGCCSRHFYGCCRHRSAYFERQVVHYILAGVLTVSADRPGAERKMPPQSAPTRR